MDAVLKVSCHTSRRVLDEIIGRERKELERREQAFRRDKPPSLRDRTVILVDDGLGHGGLDARAA